MTTIKELNEKYIILAETIKDNTKTIEELMTQQEKFMTQIEALTLKVELIGKTAKEVDDKQWKKINELKDNLPQYEPRATPTTYRNNYRPRDY